MLLFSFILLEIIMIVFFTRSFLSEIITSAICMDTIDIYQLAIGSLPKYQG